jgi:hypothetical protein
MSTCLSLPFCPPLHYVLGLQSTRTLTRSAYPFEQYLRKKFSFCSTRLPDHLAFNTTLLYAVHPVSRYHKVFQDKAVAQLRRSIYSRAHWRGLGNTCGFVFLTQSPIVKFSVPKCSDAGSHFWVPPKSTKVSKSFHLYCLVGRRGFTRSEVHVPGARKSIIWETCGVVGTELEQRKPQNSDIPSLNNLVHSFNHSLIPIQPIDPQSQWPGSEWGCSHKVYRKVYYPNI